ncbi:MAG: cardiolipin synthase, partial [Hafnia sp.]
MTTFYTVISWLAIFGYWLLIASVTLRILMKRRAVPSAMAWLLIIYILPLVGIIAYLSFGELHLGKRRAERAKAMWPSTAHWLADLKNCKSIFATGNSEVATPLFQLCERRQGIAGVKGNQLQLLTTSDDTLKALIRDIELARSNIEMVFYIWQPGGLADQVAESLMAAARRGVHCRLLLDSAGSVTFFRSPYPAMMRNAGVEVVEALKVNLMRVFLRRMDLRQHRKVVLIDNFIAYTGSMNLVDPRFFKQDAGVGQWIDVMARMEGPVATTMGIIFSCDWEIETGKRILPPEPEYHSLPFEEESGHTIQVIASGPGFPDELIHQALLTSVYSAREQLIMTTPYFVPSDDLLH